jgi:phosphoketolase
VHGQFLRDVMKLNAERAISASSGPDETASNRLDAVFEVTDRGLDGARSNPMTTIWPRTAGSWKC